MPKGDGTGPNGMGPMTGRAAGFCAGFAMPGFSNQGAGPGFGTGFGRGGGFTGRGCFGFGRRGGLGRRNRFYATGIPSRAFAGSNTFAPRQQVDEKTAAENYARSLEAELEAVRKRLEEIRQAADKR